ncbi:hypothetical protein MASR1M65_08940 [Saprospiraceae bacterium]
MNSPVRSKPCLTKEKFAKFRSQCLVLILGLNGAPQAGEKFRNTETDAEARQIATKRAQMSREQANRANKRISLEEIGRRLALGNFKELKIIVKGDVDGSVEALSDALIKQSIESVQVNVIHKWYARLSNRMYCLLQLLTPSSFVSR